MRSRHIASWAALIALLAGCGGGGGRTAIAFLDDGLKATRPAIDDLSSLAGRTVSNSDVESAMSRISQRMAIAGDDVSSSLRDAPATAASNSRVGEVIQEIRSDFSDDLVDAFCAIREADIEEEAIVAFVLDEMGTPYADLADDIEQAIARLMKAIEADASDLEMAGLVAIELACLT